MTDETQDKIDPPAVEEALPAKDIPQPEHESAADTMVNAKIADAIDKAIASWVNSSVTNSPITRSTNAYNYLQQKLPVLKALLIKEITA